MVAVFGPSGSGKSTMLRLAAALEQPSAGDVRAFGCSLGRLERRQSSPPTARVELAIVFQGGNLWPDLTARENVELMLSVAGRTSDVDAALDAFRPRPRGAGAAGVRALGRRATARCDRCRGGARGAALVLADEPTGELDEKNESRVLDAFEVLRSENHAAVVVVTHSHQVARAADRVVVMRDGRAVPVMALTVDGVRVSYGDFQALADVSLGIARDESVALIGRSGSGKTTLLHVLAGFVRPTEGSVSRDGCESPPWSSRALT